MYTTSVYLEYVLSTLGLPSTTSTSTPFRKYTTVISPPSTDGVLST